MTLYVKEVGPARAPTIVLLHGGGVGGWMWQPQIEQLSDYHLLIPDLPEHGQSINDKPFAFERAATQIADLIRERAHGGKAHLVGLSLGAQTTAELLGRSPELIDRAVVSGTLVRRLPGVGLTRFMTKLYWPFKDANWLIRWNMRALGVPARFFAEFKQDTRMLTIDSFTRVTSANATFQLPSGLDRATAPTLVVVGQKELKIMRQSAGDLVAALPNAKGYVVAGAIHNWSLQLPELFTQTVQAWINDRPLPAGLQPLN